MAISLRFPLRRLPFRLPCHHHSVYRVQKQLWSSTVAETASSSADDNTGDSLPKIPLVPKRDPDAVLRALTSTVEPVKTQSLLGGRSFADPLAPRNRNQQMQLLRAQEAGRRAARYVVHRWPRMFPKRTPEPSLQTGKVKVKGRNELVLQHLIATRKTGNALKMYRRLMERGVAVSLETQNSLLALLAYYGLGNPYVNPREDPSRKGSSGNGRGLAELAGSGSEKELEDAVQKDSGHASDGPGVEASGRDEASSKETKGKPERLWSKSNFAEKFFAEMSKKNGATYDALISGLVKFKEYDRAMEMFQTMREEGYQASLPTYNSMLDVIDANNRPWWDRAKSIINEMMGEPIVMPNVTTMNVLLKLCKTSPKEFAIKIMREMAYLRIEPTPTTFLRLMQCFMHHGDGSIVYEIVDYIESNEHLLAVHEEFDLYFLSTAMCAARFLSDHELAMRIQKIAEKDSLLLVNNLNYFFGHYLIALVNSGDLELIKQEYDELVPKVTVPFEWIYGAMFRVCKDASSPEYALKLWNDMLKFRVPVQNAHSIARFCGALYSKIDLTKADSYINALVQALKKVQYESIKPPETLLSRLVSLHAEIDDLDKAWEYFGLFKQYDVPLTFAALSSLLKAHSAHCDAQKTEEVMEMMIQRGFNLPANYVRDICWNVGLDSATVKGLVSGFAENAYKKTKLESAQQENYEQS